MASSTPAGPSPPPPPPGGWLSGFVSGAGRILAGVAAVLGPESSSDAASSSPESSQSPSPPPPSRALVAADQGNDAHLAIAYPGNLGYIAYDNYQFDKSGKDIVLKDYGKDFHQLASHIDRKDALADLLMQETYSRSEYVALKKIIKERMVDSDPIIDEPDVALPIAWQPSAQKPPVALSPQNSPLQTSSFPAYSLLFDNAGEKRGLEKGSTTTEDPCTLKKKNLNHDQHRHVVKRSNFNTVDTFEDPRRVRSKPNKYTSKEVIDALSSHGVFDDPVTSDAGEGELRGVPEELKNIPLLGTVNLTFSNIASKGETARPHRQLVTTSRRDLTETVPVKVETHDDPAPLEPEMMHLAQKNDERTMSNDPCPVSTMILQETIVAAPSSSNGLKPENRNRKLKQGFNLPGIIPSKSRSPTSSGRRPSNWRTIRSRNRPPQERSQAAVEQEPMPCYVQEKRPVGRPRKAMRSRKTESELNIKRRLQL